MAKRTKTESAFSESPVASDQTETGDITRLLIKDLELGEGALPGDTVDLSSVFGEFFKLSDESFRRMGLDFSVVMGVSGDWPRALEAVNRLVANAAPENPVRLWEMRCLVECGRYAEALALGRAIGWESKDLVHVNYLTGQAFEALGMREQAHMRFEAVKRRDPHYRDIQFKNS